MGQRSLNRIHFSEWAKGAPDIGRMQRDGWHVRASCANCGLEMTVDLEHVIRLRGPRFSLWGKRAICRDLRCPHGMMTFHGLPPRGMLWGELTKHYLRKQEASETPKPPPVES